MEQFVTCLTRQQSVVEHLQAETENIFSVNNEHYPAPL